MRKYLLVLEMDLISKDSKQIDAALSGTKSVLSWSSPFSGCYFFQSSKLSASDLVDDIQQIIGEEAFFVLTGIQQFADDITGSIPEEIWRYVNPFWIDEAELSALDRAS